MLHLLAIAAFAQGAATKPSFELLAQDLSEREVRVDVVSPDGKCVLCHTGAEPARGPLYLVRDEKVETYLRDKPATHRIVAVTDGGIGLGAVVVRNQKGTGLGALVYHDGGFDWVSPPLVDEMISFEPTGFTADGRILATCTTPKAEVVLVGKPGEWKTLWTSPHTLQNHACAETPSGVVGGFGYVLSATKNSVRATSRAGYLTADGVTWMSLPPSATSSLVTACSPDGEFVGGVIYQGSARAAIWQRSQIAFTFKDVGYAASTLWTGISNLGHIAVGRSGYTTPKQALIWRQKEGAQFLADFLKDRKIEVPEGWVLVNAVSITADGSTIVGEAKGEKGRIRPFRVHVGSPDTAGGDGEPKSTGSSGGG